MADNKENCPPFPLTALQSTQPHPKRKRVALSDIQIVSTPSHLNRKKRPAVDVCTAQPSVSEPSLKSCDDGLDVEDPQMCPYYVSDIYRYLRSMEVEPKRRALGDYIRSVQKDVTESMRAILVDWLVEVAEEYRLLPDTLHLTVSIVDRFLSHNLLDRHKLQLLGVSAMLIASKYEEITPPTVEDFCFITDNTYTKQEVVKMERDVLKFLKFEVGNPTIKTFLMRFSAVESDYDTMPDLKLEFMGRYLAELSLLDYSLVKFLPSVVAAAAVFVARFILNTDKNPWSQKMQELTGYKVSELKDCISAIYDLHLCKRISSLVAVRDKYTRTRYKCVSCYKPECEIPSTYFEDISE